MDAHRIDGCDKWHRGIIDNRYGKGYTDLFLEDGPTV
jgi:hypothetical protein